MLPAGCAWPANACTGTLQYRMTAQYTLAIPPNVAYGFSVQVVSHIGDVDL